MYQLDIEVVNATISYLATRPYGEVHELMDQLRAGTMVEDEVVEEVSEE